MANNAMARIFGYDSPDDLIAGLNALPLRYSDPERREKLLRLLHTRDTISGFESQAFRKNGMTIWISEDIQVIRNKQGRVNYYRGSVRDISDRKRKEEVQWENEKSLRSWADKAERSKECCFGVIDEICAAYNDLEKNFLSFLAAISNTVESKRMWMKEHSEKVAAYAVKIAGEIRLDETEIQNIRLAALCSDIGALCIHDALIDKPSPLTVEEYEKVKQHPLQTFNLLRDIEPFSDILPLVRHHHERSDGQGYPDGLKNDEIPVGAKILHIAESFDAMTSDRPYRPAPGKEYAVSELRKHAGKQFDPHIVEAAIKTLGD
jgi:PAS domain S-box-containing protein